MISDDGVNNDSDDADGDDDYEILFHFRLLKF